MQAIITVGAPGSGKSTWAGAYIQQRWDAAKEDWREVNRDKIRFEIVKPGGDWSTWNMKDEGEVQMIWEQQIVARAKLGQNIIISDTNTHEGRRKALIRSLEALGYTVSIQTFIETPYEQLVKRDAHRSMSVGAHVIGKHHFPAVEQFGKRYEPHPGKTAAVIVDIDGTVAQMHDRGPFEWHKVGQDLPRREVMAAVDGIALAFGADVIMTSGRDASCREETVAWLNKHGMWFNALYMRPHGDMRKDTTVKSEIFWRDIEPHYNVVAAFDDRPVIVRLWHEIGIPNVFAVANPYLEF